MNMLRIGERIRYGRMADYPAEVRRIDGMSNWWAVTRSILRAASPRAVRSPRHANCVLRCHVEPSDQDIDGTNANYDVDRRR